MLQERVKNRAPAPIQISAEQILREAEDRQEQQVLEPIAKIHDAEYQAFLRDRRKHFEVNIWYWREYIDNWVKYARFEEENQEIMESASPCLKGPWRWTTNPQNWSCGCVIQSLKCATILSITLECNGKSSSDSTPGGLFVAQIRVYGWNGRRHTQMSRHFRSLDASTEAPDNDSETDIVVQGHDSSGSFERQSGKKLRYFWGFSGSSIVTLRNRLQ